MYPSKVHIVLVQVDYKKNFQLERCEACASGYVKAAQVGIAADLVLGVVKTDDEYKPNTERCQGLRLDKQKRTVRCDRQWAVRTD